MLFNSIPIGNYIFSLLHAEIDIGNKIIDSFYSWMTKYSEPLPNEEIEISNNLIDLQVKQTQKKKLIEQINQQNITKITDLTTEKELIESALKNKGGTTRFLLYGDLNQNTLKKLIS